MYGVPRRRILIAQFDEVCVPVAVIDGRATRAHCDAAFSMRASFLIRSDSLVGTGRNRPFEKSN